MAKKAASKKAVSRNAITKTKDWFLDSARTYYGMAIDDSRYGITSTRRSQWIKNRIYANGEYDRAKFLSQLVEPDEDGKREGYINIDFTSVAIVSKYRDVVLGYLDKIDFDPFVNALDEVSKNKKNRIKFRMWAKSYLKRLLQDIEQEAGINVEEGNIMMPESIEEIQLYIENEGLKLPEEMAFKDACNIVLKVNRWVESVKQIKSSLFDYGIAGSKAETDHYGKINVRALDMINTYIISNPNTRDYSKAMAIGEVFRITIGDLRQEAGNQFTNEEYIEIANKASGKYGNPEKTFATDRIYTPDHGMYEWDNFNIEVFDVSWDDNDIDTKYKRYRNDEDYLLYNKPAGYRLPKNAGEKDEVVVTHINTKYKCKLIVGTDKIYDFGKVRDIVDSETDLARTEYDYTIYESTKKPHIERMIPFADAIQLSWQKIQNLKAKAAPPGLIIDTSAIESVSYGGKELTSKQVLKIRNETGDLLYTTDGHYQIDNPLIGGSTPVPIRPLDGGLGQQFSEFIADMNNNINMIQAVTGINDIFDSSTPNPEQPVGTARLAYNAAVNSLSGLIDAYKFICQGTYRKIIRKLQIIARFGGIEHYKNAIGASAMETIKYSTEMAMIDLGVNIEARVTEKDKNDLLALAVQAMGQRAQSGQGGIDVSDYLMIKRYVDDGRIRAAEAMLNHRMIQRKKEDMAMQERLAAAKSEGDMRSNLASADKRIQEERMKTQNEIVLLKTKSMLKMQEDNNKARIEAMRDAIKNKLDIDKLNAEWDRRDKQFYDKLEAMINGLLDKGGEKTGLESVGRRELNSV